MGVPFINPGIFVDPLDLDVLKTFEEQRPTLQVLAGHVTGRWPSQAPPTLCRTSRKNPLVILESPYAGDIERNLIYGRRAMRDCLLRGESPYASHLLYTQPGVLDDNVQIERDMGIQAGFLWRFAADYTVVYQDYGVSRGMDEGIQHALSMGQRVERRWIGENDNRL